MRTKAFHPSISDSLATNGYAVLPGFLGPSFSRSVRDAISDRRARGLFHRAGVGRGEALLASDSIRRDTISWLEAETDSKTEVLLWASLNDLKEHLNRELFLGLWDLETHFAIYGPGAFYARHLDRFQDDDTRVVSIVLYFNESWLPAYGGELVLHLEQGPIVVEPREGTLVCFMSDRIEHEVLVSRDVDRISLAGWFRRRASLDRQL